jgi:hypothetical protein
MDIIYIKLEAKALIPTLDVYREYFDAKYPCTKDSNDGSEMSLEDQAKFATYNHLLSTYEKMKRFYRSEYNKLIEDIALLESS